MDSYGTKPVKVMEKGKNLYELLNAPFQGVKRLSVLAYAIAVSENNKADIKDNKKFFLPRGEIKNDNVFIDGRNFYNQSINDLMKHYDEIRKESTC